MKRIWKTRRDEDAVSPVIATILMVAITVVLAAVLYVMVIGFGGTTGTAPAGNFNALTPQSSTSAKLVVGTFNPEVRPSDVKIILTPTTGAEITLSWPGQLTQETTTLIGGNATYKDYNWQGDILSAGDFIIVGDLTGNTKYTAKVYHIGSDGMCTLTGATTFTTPP